MLVDLQTQGSGDTILPALIVGYDVTDRALRFVVEQTQGMPGWLFLLSPQVGGSCMSYPQLLGVVLRLDTQRQRGVPGLARLVRALRAMGEDPDRVLLRDEFPQLIPLVLTSNRPYTAQELGTLHRLVSDSLTLPLFDQGVEALLRVQPVDPMALVADWSVLSGEVREGSTHPYECPPPPFIIDSSNLEDLVTTESLCYRDVHVALEQLARFLHKPQPPRVWLLWENSD